MGSRVINFSAGPAMLPAPVLSRIESELWDYRGAGASLMELSHRGILFDELVESTQARVRGLLQVPDSHAVLFLSGGATFQFAQLPMNLATQDKPGAYLVHGHWGLKAAAEAQTLGRGVVVASSEPNGFDAIPNLPEASLQDDFAYLHVVANETIIGQQFHGWPSPDIPLAADMTSDIFSRPLDFDRLGVIYAGAQKNMGIAGLSLVIVDRSLVRENIEGLPGIFSWHTQMSNDCRYNTPPTFAWYVAGLVLDWIESEGGVAEMEQRSIRRSRMLYQAIDDSDFYRNSVPVSLRSQMNVPFQLADTQLEPQFLEEAEHAGLIGLKGHKAVGGMRASLYNAMPESGVRSLVEFMRAFEARHA